MHLNCKNKDLWNSKSKFESLWMHLNLQKIRFLEIQFQGRKSEDACQTAKMKNTKIKFQAEMSGDAPQFCKRKVFWNQNFKSVQS